MSTEDPETYLRRFAETQLRRLAAGETTAAECAARVDSVAVAFEETGALDGQATARVSDDLHLALAVRSPGRGASRWLTQLSPLRAPRGGLAGALALRARTRARGILPENNQDDPPGEISVRPVGSVLRTRTEDADEDVYLLAYIASPGRAWLSVAARTSEQRVPRRHASPTSSRNPRVRSTSRPAAPFAGDRMTAADDAGRDYRLAFSGGGGEWYLGRLSVIPAPPPDAAWLEVRGGTESARIDLRAAPLAADATIRSRTGGPGELYLLRQAETLLGSRSRITRTTPGMAGMDSAVLGLRAAGLLPDGSPVPGQIAALAQRLGVPVRMDAKPGELPERWASVLEPTTAPSAGMTIATDGTPVLAASLSAVLPEADGVAVHLAGLLTRPGTGTTLFGGLRAGDTDGKQTLWLRDNLGGWHWVSPQGWSQNGDYYTFQATVEPPLGPGTTRIEFYVTGPETEVRADIPVSWWTS